MADATARLLQEQARAHGLEGYAPEPEGVAPKTIAYAIRQENGHDESELRGFAGLRGGATSSFTMGAQWSAAPAPASALADASAPGGLKVAAFESVEALAAEGLDVLARLGALYLDAAGRPWEDVRVAHAHVLEDPFPDDPALVAAFDGAWPPPSPTRVAPEAEAVRPRVAYGAAGTEPDDGLTRGERAAKQAEKKAKSQAEVLEMIGDLPHADVEVPKNELFLAKLNKVTEDADLEIIFSRFGRIESCDVVRDWKTGDSLNFAFIAFEEEASCVEAYKKMNNVLIDDSRIRVDFSQSVAKIWSRYTMSYKGTNAKKLRDKQKLANAPRDACLLYTSDAADE